ncbi:ribonuclease M5 [Baia soyae]|uniref:Ribonuclease M5 n=1 Tax=Baia soyae TaxID=1544746 RepID=A0A4R2RNI9_9BACL|nr:ribonuclease M5 [Baia soyae]TCP64634.1 RNAse M5 [Baia soyae]
MIVVEGRNDTVTIKRAVKADTIETRGSAIGKEVIDQVRRAQSKRGVIIFTDPDYAGERIRRVISQEVPGVKHAFLPQDKARGRKKIGIEHAKCEDIREALLHVRSDVGYEQVESISWEDYIDMGFTGFPDSSWLRQKVADRLGIGFANAKNFYQRLHALQVSKEELISAWLQVREELEDVT